MDGAELRYDMICPLDVFMLPPAESLASICLQCISDSPEAALHCDVAMTTGLDVATRSWIAQSLSVNSAWHDDLLRPEFFTGLLSLSFANCTRVTPAYILRILSGAMELRGLELAGSFHLADEAVLEILHKCPKLLYLGLQNCRKLTDHSLSDMVAHGTNLRHIDMGGCFNVTRVGLVTLLSHPGFALFTGLGLSGVAAVDAEYLEAVASACTRLVRLSLGFYTGHEVSIKSLLQTNPRLVFLQLQWCPGVTDQTIDAAIRHCPLLYYFDVTGDKQISPDSLQTLMSVRCIGADALPPLASATATESGDYRSASASNAHTGGLSHPTLDRVLSATSEVLRCVREGDAPSIVNRALCPQLAEWVAFFTTAAMCIETGDVSSLSFGATCPLLPHLAHQSNSPHAASSTSSGGKGAAVDSTLRCLRVVAARYGPSAVARTLNDLMSRGAVIAQLST